MTDAIRTPDELLAGLIDFPFAPSYRQFNGFRLAHVDVGDGPPVVFLHGEPTWSFLWRRVIPPVRDAGFRCIAPDLAGFGRSDKPIDLDWYSYDTHTASITALVAELDLYDATVVVHDWGGPIGLRVAADNPDRITRIVVLDTGLFTGRQPMTDAWMTFRAFVQRTEDLPVGLLVRRACLNDPGDEVIAAYDAPFPDDSYTAGARQFPMLVPSQPDDPASAANRAAWEVLERWDKPFLTAFSDGDPITRGADRVFQARVPGAAGQPHTTIAGGGHFLQEDRGAELAQVVAAFVASA
jgi:haloalkane dehalogenase